MAIYPINKLEDAENFCNRLMKFAKSKTFQPVKIDASFGKIRSEEQGNYYFWAIDNYILPYFKANPLKLVEFVLRALRFDVTKDFIHEMLKMIYLQGTSTTKTSTVTMAERMEEIRHDMHHDCGLTIPEPKQKTNEPIDSGHNQPMHNID